MHHAWALFWVTLYDQRLPLLAFLGCPKSYGSPGAFTTVFVWTLPQNSVVFRVYMGHPVRSSCKCCFQQQGAFTFTRAALYYANS